MTWLRMLVVVPKAMRVPANLLFADLDFDTGGDQTFSVGFAPADDGDVTHYAATGLMSQETLDRVYTEPRFNVLLKSHPGASFHVIEDETPEQILKSLGLVRLENDF